jgi:thymidylate synthase (FAD)
MAETRRPTVAAAEEILSGYFPVLDHGFVSLVDYMGGDEDIERAARVSYGYGTRKVSQTRGLVRYLRRHMHTTPSEMVELKFHVCMPIFVARQWIRHRTANVNEYSGRYSLMPLLFYTPEGSDFALQSADNKQGRQTGGADAGIYRDAVERWEATRRQAGADYQWLVGQDVARELARIDLPLSTYTQWYWKIDLHNLIHFLTLRADPHAQYEIRVYAEVMAGMLKRVAPLSYEAWIDYAFAAAPMSRAELAALRELIDAPSTDDDGEVTLRARQGASLDQAALADLGLSKREALELVDKLQPAAIPDFELDLTSMRSAEEMARTMQAAVPQLE